jgi:flagellin
MANDVTLSKGVRANLLSLQNTAEMMAKVQERLSTGKKVNSALDSPVNFFTAAGLNARASDLSTLLDAIGNGVQTLAAADKGITAISKLVESLKSTAKQAIIAGSDVTYAQNIQSGALANDAAVAAVAAGSLTIQAGSGAVQTITFGNGVGEVDTIAELQAAIGALSLPAGVAVSFNGSNEIEIDSTSDQPITIGGTGATLTALGLTSGTTQPVATVGTPNATRASLQNDYNELLNQITQLAQDASFNGVNLLDQDNLTVTFNEDGSSSLVIQGVDFTAAGLGLTPIAGDGFQVPANVSAALAQLDAATATLRSQASAFGSNLSIVQARQDFTKNLINVLEIGADNLTLADTNEEGANLLALQTRQSLSTTSLSMAAQADQNVLRLFQ